ncbi:MAG: hypothetical protein KGK08_14605 [Acidobacteriota bacterium]|nr:hypothetical protein [Acidobacteriota bacterium]
MQRVKRMMQQSGWTAMVAALVVLLVAMPLQGCVSQGQIAALTQTLGTSSANIATIEGNTQLAAQLLADTNAAVMAIDNWKTGTTTQNIVEALGIVQQDLNLIPATSQYTPLIDVAIATVQSILVLLPASSASTTPTIAHPTRVVSLGHPAPKTAGEFRKQWNAVCAKNAALAPAVIR